MCESKTNIQRYDYLCESKTNIQQYNCVKAKQTLRNTKELSESKTDAIIVTMAKKKLFKGCKLYVLIYANYIFPTLSSYQEISILSPQLRIPTQFTIQYLTIKRTFKMLLQT